MAAQAAACVKHSCLNYADAELQEIIDESNWRYNQAFEEAQRQHQQPVSSLPFVQSTGTGYSSEVSAPSRGLSLCVGLHVVQRHIRSTALKLFSASFFCTGTLLSPFSGLPLLCDCEANWWVGHLLAFPVAVRNTVGVSLVVDLVLVWNRDRGVASRFSESRRRGWSSRWFSRTNVRDIYGIKHGGMLTDLICTIFFPCSRCCRFWTTFLLTRTRTHFLGVILTCSHAPTILTNKVEEELEEPLTTVRALVRQSVNNITRKRYVDGSVSQIT